MTAHRVYFCFNYQRDRHRASQIHRLPEIISRSAAGFDTSTLWLEGDKERLVKDALLGTTVTVVCLGYMTRHNKDVDYQIRASLAQGNGLVGIKVNHLKDDEGNTDGEGMPPPIIEAKGYNIYPYTDTEQLVAHIEEAYALAQLSEAERLARKAAAVAPEPEPEVERREDTRRETAHGSVTIGDQSYPIRNWNSRGFLAGAYTGPLSEGERTEVACSIKAGDSAFAFACQARIMRVDRETEDIAAMFVGLDADNRAAIDRHFGSRLAAS